MVGEKHRLPPVRGGIEMSKNMNGGRKGIPDEYRKDFTEME